MSIPSRVISLIYPADMTMFSSIHILGALAVVAFGSSLDWPPQADFSLLDARIDMQEEPSGSSTAAPVASVHAPKEIDPAMIEETLKYWNVQPRLVFFRPLDMPMGEMMESPTHRGIKRSREEPIAQGTGSPISSPLGEMTLADKQFGFDLLIANPLIKAGPFEAAMRENNGATNPDRVRRFYTYHAMDEIVFPIWVHRLLERAKAPITPSTIQALTVSVKNAYRRKSMLRPSGLERRIFNWFEFCLVPMAKERAEGEEPPCYKIQRWTGSAMVLSAAQRRIFFIKSRAELGEPAAAE